MVRLVENPNFRDDSCCKVDVVKGAAGFLLDFFCSIFMTLKSFDEIAVTAACAQFQCQLKIY